MTDAPPPPLSLPPHSAQCGYDGGDCANDTVGPQGSPRPSCLKLLQLGRGALKQHFSFFNEMPSLRLRNGPTEWSPGLLMTEHFSETTPIWSPKWASEMESPGLLMTEHFSILHLFHSSIASRAATTPPPKPY